MNFKNIGHSFRGACFKFQLLPVLPFLINYSQKFSSIEDWTQLHGANKKALLGGIWPIRGRHSGPITGCIWLRYSQSISPLGAAVAALQSSWAQMPMQQLRGDRLWWKYRPMRGRGWPIRGSGRPGAVVTKLLDIFVSLIRVWVSPRSFSDRKSVV